MTLKQAKVTIIGAGPAGQIASLFLAKKGIPSVLIEKEEHPRSKACSDIVFRRAIRILHELDSELPIDAALVKDYLPVTGLLFQLPKNKVINFDFKPLINIEHLPTCFAIPRSKFDHWLLQKVKASPLIELYENTTISLCERDEVNKEWTIFNAEKKPILQTKLLVIATGANSSLPLSIQEFKTQDRDMVIGVRAYFRNIEIDKKSSQHVELFLDQKFWPGAFYYKFFNDGTAAANMIIRSDLVKRKKINLNQLFYQFISENPVLKERFKNAEQIGKLEGGTLPLGTKIKPISGDGYLLIGDAAALIDLFSANGIEQAMITGSFAAKQIEVALQNNDFSAFGLSDYDKKVYKKVENDLQLGRILSPFFSYEISTKIFFFLVDLFAKSKMSGVRLHRIVFLTKRMKKILNPKFLLKSWGRN